MFDRFKNLLTVFQSPDDSVLGIDIGSAYLKVVQLRRKGGKAILETYGSLATGPYAGVDIGRASKLPPDKIAEALHDLLREAHATSTRAAFAIPFTSSLVTTMDMRVLDQKQLATAVFLEARKYIPVPISEVNLDWWIIPEEPSPVFSLEEKVSIGAPLQSGASNAWEAANRPTAAPSSDYSGSNTSSNEDDSTAPRNMKILIAAIHNEALGRYQDIVTRSGLLSSFFEIELFSTIRSLFPQDLEPHAVIDLGAGETKLYIIDRGLVRLSHIINYGGQDITLAISRSLGITVEEAEKKKLAEGLESGGEEKAGANAILNVICAETNRVISGFSHKFGRKVTEIILSGGGANLRGIETLVQDNLLIPVLRADPFKQVEAPAFLDEVLEGVGPEFTVAIGIAFRKLQENG